MQTWVATIVRKDESKVNFIHKPFVSHCLPQPCTVCAFLAKRQLDISMFFLTACVLCEFSLTELVNILHARSRPSIKLSLICCRFISAKELPDLFTFSASIIPFDCFNCTSSTSVLPECKLESGTIFEKP